MDHDATARAARSTPASLTLDIAALNAVDGARRSSSSIPERAFQSSPYRRRSPAPPTPAPAGVCSAFASAFDKGQPPPAILAQPIPP